MSEPSHLTDKTADMMDDAANAAGIEANHVPGPSPNPATNLVIHDIVLRSVGRLSRMAVEKALLGRQYGREFAKDAVENRSIVQTLAAYGVTKVATRSIPGFALVSTGLLAKTLFDRSQSRRKAERNGDKTLREQADPDSMI
ncbi:hypothetical protein CP97_12865 [Aurantiacibacter atlanticus]|uniref:Uncharacterized protein n=1 Tax=Aurantiacibacter atlanticus TaxID=1648404 RepID=A0A0H4VII7_9SPHN|nr:hypothetical protein [Aurantiacibacter atlanticus]AKQ42739.2 hypothetical protein CP97_12865 [Aurantiacibacter atlanticus]MDF1835400.1 hypothetical protein [Alteraurantiacibacter sp. bin_em_oilr2.035]